jgi:glycosyltransferase involved in cell wall biosynthesis
LTYLGKETKISVIKRVVSMGIKFKAFGAKMEFLDRGVIEHPNIEFLGRISTGELVEAYSNALFTLFPFTHEPFGYVPLESMACGTPVLTYNLQGPSEYVIDGCTGWLARSDGELVQKAMKLWKEGYPSCVRLDCVKEASKFDRRFYLEKWLKVLDGLCGGQVSL